MNTKKLTIDSMLAAMCAVLGFLAIDLGYAKISLEALPVILGALLFGPLDGVLIGGVGSFISQLLKYGISMTTALWMLPYIVCGFMVGSHAKNNNFNMSKAKLTIVVVTNQLLVMFLNTVVMYVDSKLYGYYSPELIFGYIVLRLGLYVGLAIVYSLVLPPIIKAIKKNF